MGDQPIWDPLAYFDPKRPFMTPENDSNALQPTKDGTYIIGVDVGTTAVKATLVNSNGVICKSFSQSYDKTHPQEGWVEQNPDEWVRLIFKAIEQFSCHVSLTKISAICVCSQVNTHVFVDNNHDALRPAIVWSDTRAKNNAAELDNKFNTAQKIEKWGFEFVLDASYSISRAAWVAEHEPEVWSNTDWIVSPKDYCNYKLCGVAASDAFSSVGLATAEGRYINGLNDLLEGIEGKLPPLRDMFGKIGITTVEQFPALKADIFAGTMDAWANFIGSGVVDNGDCALIAGTSSIIGVMSKEANPAKGAITFPPFKGLFLHAGPTQAGSDAFAWFAKLAEKEIEAFLHDLSLRELTSSAPLFLPHLQGERAPLWDPNARGTFIGLTHQHDFVDMALAVAEGVAYSERHVLEVCSQAAGFNPTKIHISGGASRNDFWTQLRADCLGVTLQRLEEINSGVLGSAIIAMVGRGIYPNIQQAANVVVNLSDAFSPLESYRNIYETRYALYKDSYLQLKPIFDRLAG